MMDTLDFLAMYVRRMQTVNFNNHLVNMDFNVNKDYKLSYIVIRNQSIFSSLLNLTHNIDTFDTGFIRRQLVVEI